MLFDLPTTEHDQLDPDEIKAPSGTDADGTWQQKRA
jgi:hypothetical protein